MNDTVATKMRGTARERRARTRSTAEVVAVNTTAAITDRQDLVRMVVTATNPSREASQPKGGRVNSVSPCLVNMRGTAARMKGRARAERRSTSRGERPPEATASGRGAAIKASAG